jgi:hypothetical protein
MKIACCVLRDFRFYVPLMILLYCPYCKAGAQVVENDMTRQAKTIQFPGRFLKEPDSLNWIAKANYIALNITATNAPPKNADKTNTKFGVGEQDTIQGKNHKNKPTSGSEPVLLELMPSTMTTEIGGKNIIVLVHTVRDNNGEIIASGSALKLQLSSKQWQDLGVDKFDGKEKEIVLKADSTFVHYFVHEKWNGVLEVKELKVAGKGDGTLNSAVLMPNGQFYKPLAYHYDKSSILIAEDTGIFGIVLGFRGYFDLKKPFQVDKIQNPVFVNEKNAVKFTGSNCSKWMSFKKDSIGQITGNGDFLEKDSVSILKK